MNIYIYFMQEGGGQTIGFSWFISIRTRFYGYLIDICRPPMQLGAFLSEAREVLSDFEMLPCLPQLRF